MTTNSNRPKCVTSLLVMFVASSCLILADADSVLAQFSFSSEDRMARMFDYLDRNRDGKVDEEEIGRMRGGFGDALKNSGLDFKRGVSKDKLVSQMPKIMESMRSRYSSGSSRRGGYDRGSSGRRGSSSSSKKKEKKPRPRVTVDLPEAYKERDKNKDGQIALHEWRRSAFAQFLIYDTNGDGFLTPRELVKAGDIKIGDSRSKTTTTASTTKASTSKSSTTSSSSATKSSSGSGSTIDKNSREYRYASFVFKSLDRNKDKKLTADEWERSRRTKQTFEKANVKLALPADSEQFLQSYLQVAQANKKK